MSFVLAIDQGTTSSRAIVFRSDMSIAATAQADAAFTGVLGKLVAVAEAYPDLKASANFQQLQVDLGNVEDKLAAARRFSRASFAPLQPAMRAATRRR